METRQAEGVPFAVLNPSDLKNPKMGTTNAQNLDAPEIHVVHPLRGRKKSLNSMMNFSNHSKNGRDIPPKNSGQAKKNVVRKLLLRHDRLKFTLVVVITPL